MKKPSLLPALVVFLATTAHAQRAQQADQFVDSVGINTHITYTNTAYSSQWPRVFSALQGMHIRHIRDGYYNWAAGDQMYAKHQQLHQAGIDCDFVIGTTVPTADQIANFKELAGDMFSLEAPNEMDDKKGANWVGALHQMLPSLYEAGAIAGVPVLGPSLVYKASYYSLGDVAASMNYNNLHVYFGGRNPGSTGWGSRDADGNYYGSIRWWLDNADVDGPGVPSIVTETGYIANSTFKPYTLPQDIEAKYAQRTMLEMFNAGVSRSYFYEMVDEVSSEGYGMMKTTLQPKLAYNAVSELLGLLEDQGRSFTPAALNYTLNGAKSDVHKLLLQKRDGTFYLVLWIEESGYNEVNSTYINVPTQTVQLSLDNATVQAIDSFSEQGAMSRASQNSQSNMSLTLSDRVTVVEIQPKG